MPAERAPTQEIEQEFIKLKACRAFSWVGPRGSVSPRNGRNPAATHMQPVLVETCQSGSSVRGWRRGALDLGTQLGFQQTSEVA